MTDIIDFVLKGETPGLFEKLEFEREPSTTDLIISENRLKQFLGEEVSRDFCPYIELMDKYCGKDEAIKELKERVEIKATVYWLELIAKSGVFDSFYYMGLYV